MWVYSLYVAWYKRTALHHSDLLHVVVKSIGPQYGPVPDGVCTHEV